MVDFATSGAATHKAGVSMSTAIPELAWAEWASFAQATVQAEARENYIDTYATLDADVKTVVADAATSIMAAQAVKFDMSGYTSRGEAQDIINVELDNAQKQMRRLKDKKVGKTFLGN